MVLYSNNFPFYQSHATYGIDEHEFQKTSVFYEPLLTDNSRQVFSLPICFPMSKYDSRTINPLS